jgi:DNA-binding transcriptional MerR regulator
MPKLYTINELCHLASITVRTLHYYDEINILKPSQRTHKSHRRYSESDLLRLQQIVTLKHMGFSLEKIKQILNEHKFNILESLKIQLIALSEEENRIKKVAQCINYLINQHESREIIDWSKVVNIVEALKRKEIDSQEWYEKYLTAMEIQHFKQFAKKRTQKWKLLFKQIKDNLATDPQGDFGIQLVKKWIALADEAYANRPNLRDKLWESYKAGVIPHRYFPRDERVIAYLSKAFEALNNQ